MKNNNRDHLQTEWNACHQENQQLKAENERLKQQLEEVRRRQKIAIDNAYADGYFAGQVDARKARRQ